MANLAKTEETSQRVITCSQLLHFDPNSKLMENLRKISPIPTINLAQVLVYSQSGRCKQCTLSITEDFISKFFFILLEEDKPQSFPYVIFHVTQQAFQSCESSSQRTGCACEIQRGKNNFTSF